MDQKSTPQAKICIVDDNTLAREVIFEQLSVEPYKLSQVPSGVQLLEQFDSLKPDVILMDVMMPYMSGYDVCRKIKEDPARQHIPIVLVTALNSREDMLKGLEAGADEFLTKPVNAAEMRARVRTMLRIKNQYDSLQSVLHLREDLAHMLIHDMRNPLTVATLYNSFLLKRNNLKPRDKNYAMLVQDSLRNLAGFLDEILTVAKMEQGTLKLSLSSHNINRLITEVASNHSEMARIHGLELVVELPKQAQFISVDATLLKRVIDNLLSNAFKFAPDGSRVILRMQPNPLGEPSDTICLQVLDEGPGIAPENYERIFNKYEVVALKQSGREQIGLGLAFCKMVVEAHNGRITVSPNEPKGAIFTIRI